MSSCTESPTAVLSRVRLQLQASRDRCALRQAQGDTLEDQVRRLTDQLHGQQQLEQQLRCQHRHQLQQLEERLAAEQRQADAQLTAARHQLKCCQADVQAGERRQATLANTVRTLQLERVTHEQRIRQLQNQLRARELLCDSVSDQLVRQRQTGARVQHETDKCRQWLRRLAAQHDTVTARQQQLQLLTQHQERRLQLLTSAARGEVSDTSDVTARDGGGGGGVEEEEVADSLAELAQAIAARDATIQDLTQQLREVNNNNSGSSSSSKTPGSHTDLGVTVSQTATPSPDAKHEPSPSHLPDNISSTTSPTFNFSHMLDGDDNKQPEDASAMTHEH